MKKNASRVMRTLATRSMIAAIPVAMVAAYATNASIPTPPRMVSMDYQQVAEITVSPDTVGIAASPLYGQTKAQIDAQLDQMQALGVQNIRVFVPWGLIDYSGPSDPGSASWSTLDLVMQSAKEHDMGVMAEINSTPPYAVTSGSAGTGTPDTTDFSTFLTKFVDKYGSVVSAYEIWNEPNAVLFSNPIDPAAYDALVKAAYQVIKPLDPTATVVAGAVGHVVTFGNLTMDPVDFVKAMIAADPTIGQYFDALSYHPYDETLPFSQGNVDPNSSYFASDTAYNQLKDLVALFPDKKVWLSEFGVPTYSYTDANGVVHTVTQAQQEQYIADLINTWGAAFGQNAGPIFLYTGRDTQTGSSNADDNYGLWDMLGQPKEVITDFLTQWFKDHPQNSTGPTNPGNPGTPSDPAAALAAAFQAIAQQFAQAISQAFSQIQNLGQQIANAIVSAIANALAGLGQPKPAAAAAPLALRVASVETSKTASLAGASTETETTTSSSTATGVEAKPAATAEATPAVTDAKAAPDAQPAAASAEPVVATPEVKEPVVTEPGTTTPAAATPPTAPPPTAPAPTTPTPPESTSNPSTASGTPAASKDDGDGPSSPSTGDGAGAGATKSGEKAGEKATPGSGKPAKDGAAAHQPGSRTSGPTARHSTAKGDDSGPATDSKPKTDAISTSESHPSAA